MGKVEDLKQQLRELELLQANCKHDWPKEATYNPYQKQDMEYVQVK